MFGGDIHGIKFEAFFTETERDGRGFVLTAKRIDYPMPNIGLRVTLVLLCAFALLVPWSAYAETPKSCAALFAQTGDRSSRFTQVRDPHIRNFLSRAEDRFENKFRTDTGIAFSKFRAELLNRKEIKASANLYENEDFQVIIYRPRAARTGIADRGFSNVHESGKTTAAGAEGSSLAMKNYVSYRSIVEAGLLELDTAIYQTTLVGDRARYAMLRLDPIKYPESATFGYMATHYGDDVFVFKNDRIRDRTLFAIGDSMDRTSTDIKPKDWKPETWDDGLIPWKARSILAIETHPFLKGSDGPSIRVSRRGEVQELQAQYSKISPSLGRYTRRETPDRADPTGKIINNGMNYIEADIFGRLSLDDVQAFEFTERSPEGAFLDALKKRGILIIDARTEPKIWWQKN